MKKGLKDYLKASTDIPQQIPTSFDLGPGENSLYSKDSNNEWIQPTKIVTENNQTNKFDQALSFNLPRTFTEQQALYLLKDLFSEQQIKEIYKQIKQNPTQKTADQISKTLDLVKNTKTFENLIHQLDSEDEITIQSVELQNGAIAQAMPNNTIFLDNSKTQIDEFLASRLIHELSHLKDFKDNNYLDDPQEQQAYKNQIQYLLEVGCSENYIKKHLLPTFENYKNKQKAKNLLNSLIEEAQQDLIKIANTNINPQSFPIHLTFSSQEQLIIDKVRLVAENLGIKVFLAGGLIRDRLLGIPNQDLDFVTNKGSEQLAAYLAQKYKLSNPIKMERSGATMVHMDDFYIDIINADKVFSPIGLGSSSSLEQGQEAEMTIFLDDSFRRDLTINSLMYSLHTRKLYDPTGHGISDIHNKIIRTIIDPYIKYRIQAPDMLRALRFYATKPGFQFAPNMIKAMKSNSWRILPREKHGDISARRIERELRRAAKTPESWNRMRGALEAVGLDDILDKQIKNVEDDMKGSIEYNFDKKGSTSLPSIKVDSMNKDEELNIKPTSHLWMKRMETTAVELGRGKARTIFEIMKVRYFHSHADELFWNAYFEECQKALNDPPKFTAAVEVENLEVEDENSTVLKQQEILQELWAFSLMNRAKEFYNIYLKNKEKQIKNFWEKPSELFSEKIAADYAGRPLPDDLSLPQFLINPYQEKHENYSGTEILRKKYLEHQNNKVLNKQRHKLDEEKKDKKQ